MGYRKGKPLKKVRVVPRPSRTDVPQPEKAIPLTIPVPAKVPARRAEWKP